MTLFDRSKHWENIYSTKALNEVSWYQEKPTTSLDFIHEFNIPTTAKIIDIGGGDSFLVDHLLDMGFEDLTVLDISAASLERAQKRLGEKSSKVKWIVSDVCNFEPKEQYDFWHDRAAFHFLTEKNDVNRYLKVIQNGIAEDGILILGTFSETGPLKCSGIEIKQYSEESMTETIPPSFEKINCITVDHPTPFDTVQNFLFCSFRKKD